MDTRQLIFLGFCVLFTFAYAKENGEQKVDPEKVDYAKGSVCGYCEYCKVCANNDFNIIDQIVCVYKGHRQC